MARLPRAHCNGQPEAISDSTYRSGQSAHGYQHPKSAGWSPYSAGSSKRTRGRLPSAIDATRSLGDTYAPLVRGVDPHGVCGAPRNCSVWLPSARPGTAVWARVCSPCRLAAQAVRCVVELACSCGCGSTRCQMTGPRRSSRAMHATAPGVSCSERAAGFVGTELYRDAGRDDRYLTIDRWQDEQDWRSFLVAFGSAYDSLDARLEGLAVAGRSLFEGSS